MENICDARCLDLMQTNITTGFVLNSLSLLFVLYLIIRSVATYKVFGFTLKLLVAMEVGILCFIVVLSLQQTSLTEIKKQEFSAEIL